jgi:hypothetical protein
VVFLAYEVRLRQLNVNHRWDSGALAMAAVLLAERAQRTERPALWAASGFLIAAAACATPSILLAALPLLYWSGRTSRSGALSFLAGGALAGGSAAAYLAWSHALLPMIQSMRWTAANYTQANRISYGGILAGAQGTGWLRIVGVAFSLVPAIFPLLAIVGWLLYSRKNSSDSASIMPLLAVVAALVLATWPRWTSDALLHTLALSWFLCGLLFYRLTAGWHREWFCLVALAAALVSLTGKAMAAMDYEPRETRVGYVRAPADESELLADLENRIPRGASLFSFPYLPSVYYFLDVRNPTYYSFLQPGMMTVADEHRAVEELEADPPHWLIYEDYPPGAVLALWPGSNPARLTLEALTAYLKTHYQPVETVNGPYGSLVVMENNRPATAR